ncbi:TetR family transcriptional regulator [Mycolicibacterium anyangense]|uniref:TetR family transcriptional regulator n=1 Tax=Mycolicibacterium anyangense TaxID=1431246 RepID=A0A6N4W6T1_9MYCO|nr:TetR family transcriptional regulator [Mycolicibacterium anyangense]BBZ77680.1 TetR family transcriptional regulator [Mycolicibacterium anyangense]
MDAGEARGWSGVAGEMNDGASGLRERKKQRTRATLIDVAARLCVEQGYDNTTVDQIAAAADVSARTFSRYFPNKEAVVVAVISDVADGVAAAFDHQPLDITEHEALMRSTVETFRGGPAGQPDPAVFDRMTLLLKILGTAPDIGLSAFSYRPEGPQHSVFMAIARRMRVPPDHPALRILFDTWAVLMGVACAGLGAPGAPPIEPELLCERIESTYALFARLWTPWHTQGQPPAGESAQ